MKQWPWQSPKWCQQKPNRLCHGEVSEKKSTWDAWAEPSAGCGRDYNPVIVKFKFRFRLTRQKVENVEWIDWKKCYSEVTTEIKFTFFDSSEDANDFDSVQPAVNEAKN